MVMKRMGREIRLMLDRRGLGGGEGGGSAPEKGMRVAGGHGSSFMIDDFTISKGYGKREVGYEQDQFADAASRSLRERPVNLFGEYVQRYSLGREI